jgi:hypothetical protein
VRAREVRHLATLTIAALVVGAGLEFALEVSTSLDRYGATLPQAINAAGHNAFSFYGLKDSLLWASFVLAALLIRAIYRYRLIGSGRSVR